VEEEKVAKRKADSKMMKKRRKESQLKIRCR